MEPPGIRMLGVLDLAKSAQALRLPPTDFHVYPCLDYRYLEDKFDRDTYTRWYNVGYN
jgi:hypothetical protein